jgi:hypothetical protein
MQTLANLALLQTNSRHPSLHFNCVHGDLWSMRIGRASNDLAIGHNNRFQWFWIGKHGEYDRLIR